MNTVYDDDGNLFIAINNRNNKSCYHVSVLQFLHSSKTLNECFRNAQIKEKWIRIFCLPMITYSKINEGNYGGIYEQLKNDYETLANEIVDNFAQEGYYPEALLCQYMLPVIYYLFPTKFEKICRELHLKKLRFTTMDYKIKELIYSNPFLKQEFMNEIYKLNQNLVQHLDEINLEHDYPFKCGYLEVFPHVYDAKDGHAIFILKKDIQANPSYYIFDDSNFISNFAEYVKDRSFSIHKISIRNIDEKSMKELAKLWGNEILTKRVNDRYELINEYDKREKDVKTIEKNIIVLSPPKMKETEVMRGGAEGRSNLFWIIIAASLAIILIVESIFAVLNYRKNKVPCPCQGTSQK